MKILVINAWSSSLKYQLFDRENEKVLAKGIAERIGTPKSSITHTKGLEKREFEKDNKDHTQALQNILEILTDPEVGVLQDLKEIDAIGHRIVHGGEYFKGSTLVGEKEKEEIRKLIPFAPLHNPSALGGIEACEKILPWTPNIAAFDTAFHQTMAPKDYLYPVPYEWYQKYGVRKYGAHGISHKFIAQEISSHLGDETLNVISCHLGNGASICAIKEGKCIDISMGFSPLTWVMMGTRSGDIDPSALVHVMHETHLSADEIMEILNKESGFKGICGKFDSRDVVQGAMNDDDICTLAQEMFVDRVANYIAMYHNKLWGADVLVFTAWIGENSRFTRKWVGERLGTLGIEIDEEKNHVRGGFRCISTKTSKIPVYVVPTNEEWMIAKDVYEIMQKETTCFKS